MATFPWATYWKSSLQSFSSRKYGNQNAVKSNFGPHYLFSENVEKDLNGLPGNYLLFVVLPKPHIYHYSVCLSVTLKILSLNYWLSEITRKYPSYASSWDYVTYHIGDQWRLRRTCAVSPEPSLFAHIKYGSRRRVRPKIRHLAPLDGCACTTEEWVYGGRKIP